jgi:hypothetical protein
MEWALNSNNFEIPGSMLAHRPGMTVQKDTE